MPTPLNQCLNANDFFGVKGFGHRVSLKQESKMANVLYKP